MFAPFRCDAETTHVRDGVNTCPKAASVEIIDKSELAAFLLTATRRRAEMQAATLSLVHGKPRSASLQLVSHASVDPDVVAN